MGLLPVVAALVNSETKTRMHGYSFGERVYVRVYTGSGDYLGNWAQAKVISADKDTVYLQGRKGFRASVHPSSVMKREDFIQHRAKLEKEGRLVDPKIRSLFKDKKPEIPHKTPTMTPSVFCLWDSLQIC
jgi:hypothetical protein